MSRWRQVLYNLDTYKIGLSPTTPDLYVPSISKNYLIFFEEIQHGLLPWQTMHLHTTESPTSIIALDSIWTTSFTIIMYLRYRYLIDTGENMFNLISRLLDSICPDW